MKLCKQCLKTKSLAEFYHTASGYPLAVCKDCHKQRMKVRRLTNPYVQQYDRQRAKTFKRKQLTRITNDRWRKEHPLAYRAQTAVNNAVRDRRLIKEPCALCGETEHVHGHHKNYAEPLKVVWLCAKCHHRLHSTFPEFAGGNSH